MDRELESLLRDQTAEAQILRKLDKIISLLTEISPYIHNCPGTRVEHQEPADGYVQVLRDGDMASRMPVYCDDSIEFTSNEAPGFDVKFWPNYKEEK